MKQTIITSAQIKKGVRGAYTAPRIEIIKLDNEISLALESAPPAGPDEVNNTTPNQLSNNPFKITMG